MYTFLWNYGAHLVSCKTIVGNKQKGGLILECCHLDFKIWPNIFVWYAIENSMHIVREDDVYNFCLFCNPKVQLNGKMLKWNDFIDAGIPHIKDISFEVYPIFYLVHTCWYYSRKRSWCKCI